MSSGPPKGRGLLSDEKGVVIEGRFSRPLELENLANRLHCMAATGLEKGEGRLKVDDWAMLHEDGSVIIFADTEEKAVRRLASLREAVLRAEECAGCGICGGRCKQGAATLSKGRMTIDVLKCTRCGACLAGPCPATTYAPETQEDVG